MLAIFKRFYGFTTFELKTPKSLYISTTLKYQTSITSFSPARRLRLAGVLITIIHPSLFTFAMLSGKQL
jgi:hypothetical protein